MPQIPRGSGRRRPSRGGAAGAPSDFGARLLTAVPAAFVGIVLIWQGGLLFAIGIALLGLVCLHELYAMFERAHPVRLAGFVSLLAMVVAAHYGDSFAVLGTIALALPLTFVLATLQARGGAPAVAVTLLGVGWVGLALAHAVLLRQLPHGDGILIDVLVGTFLGDTGAYLGGRSFGVTPLAPRISPNKTVEGLVVGIVVAVAAVWFAGLYQNWLNGQQALLLGAAVAVVAPLGDLFESYLKRDAGTKDTGRFFGPHGGALDRLDAAMFAVVAGFYVWSAMS